MTNFLDTLLIHVTAILNWLDQPVDLFWPYKLLIGFAPAILTGVVFREDGRDGHWSKRISENVFGLILVSFYMLLGAWTAYWLHPVPFIGFVDGTFGVLVGLIFSIIVSLVAGIITMVLIDEVNDFLKIFRAVRRRRALRS